MIYSDKRRVFVASFISLEGKQLLHLVCVSLFTKAGEQVLPVN